MAIIGPNGAGKSTLLKVIYGLLRPTAGKVLYRSDDVTGVRPRTADAHRAQLRASARERLPEPVDRREPARRQRLVAARERRPAVNDMYAQFPLLAERRRQRAGTLSGGQRKLLAIARALVTRPRALLLDEPSAGLSPQAVELVFNKLAEVKDRGIAIVMVEQNAVRALALADRGYVLDMGSNAYEGSGDSLLRDPKVTELYLGRSTIASSSTSTSAPSGINPPT